jgi:hypothetical protein
MTNKYYKSNMTSEKETDMYLEVCMEQEGVKALCSNRPTEIVLYIFTAISFFFFFLFRFDPIIK